MEGPNSENYSDNYPTNNPVINPASFPARNPVNNFAVNPEDNLVEGQSRFSILFRPALLYSVLFTFCLYGNIKGILIFLLGIGTVVFCNCIERKQKHTRKRDRIFYEILFVLLSLSCGLTDNTWIVLVNLAAMLFVLVVMLLHDHQDDSKWSLPKYLSEIVRTAENALGGISGFAADIRAENSRGKSEARKKFDYILIGLLIAIPMLVIVLLLLRSADIVFASVIDGMFDEVKVSSVVFIVLMTVVAFFAAYAGMRYFIRQAPAEPAKERAQYEPMIAISALSVISVVYLIFSGIQIAYLFIGNMTLPNDYTYAEYAREGFFQLLVVCLLNLLIVLFVLARFREHSVLKTLLAVICCCTYIMIASSALRMVMYIREYHLTRKRILVLWGLVMIGLLLAGVIVQIFRRDFHLFRYGFIVCALWYLVLSFGRMDYWIAKYNVEHCSLPATYTERVSLFDDDDPKVTLRYLTELSCDAAPVVVPNKASWSVEYRDKIKEVKRDSLRQWNLSRYIAKKMIE